MEGFVSTFGGPPMDDYHEFKCAHEIQIKEWRLYWSPNYVFITRGIMALSGAMVTPSISLASGGGSVSGNGANMGGGVGASINT
jgi:hypothetical protein